MFYQQLPTKRIKLEQNVEFIMPLRSKVGKENALDDILSVDESFNAQKNLQKLENDIIPLHQEKSKSLYTPVTQNSTIRTTTTVDYQPDICKDYKETGVCGWGDTCKFIHDRGEFSNLPIRTSWKDKMSIQSDKFKKSTYKTQPIAKPLQSNYVDYENIKCNACLKYLVHKSEVNIQLQPVYLKTCSHFFCESCLLSALKKETKCPICQIETNGLYFSLSDDLSTLLKKQQLKFPNSEVEQTQ